MQIYYLLEGTFYTIFVLVYLIKVGLLVLRWYYGIDISGFAGGSTEGQNGTINGLLATLQTRLNDMDKEGASADEIKIAPLPEANRRGKLRRTVPSKISSGDVPKLDE